ncbi:MAG TPA: hypothetical protein VK498_12995 [Ferruginibacter sp.]|nr:hypothetical protein [Ferruginibacter sp.]
MSIAIGAIILVLLLMPGTAAISAYYSSFTNKASRLHVPFNELLAHGLIISIFIHCASICILGLFNSHVDYVLLYKIIVGNTPEVTNKIFEKAFKQFISYTLITVGVSYLVSKWIKNFIQQRNLDLIYHSLRSTSYWFHMFGARHLEEPGVPGTLTEVDFVFVDVFTDKNILYSGRLLDFNYSSAKDELENLVLVNSQKRRFKGETIEPDKCTMTDSKLIPGNALVIKASSIVNINIFYIKLSDIPEGADIPQGADLV